MSKSTFPLVDMGLDLTGSVDIYDEGGYTSHIEGVDRHYGWEGTLLAASYPEEEPAPKGWEFIEGGQEIPAVLNGPAPLDLTGDIIRYEMGELDMEETVELFQNLVNTGLAWQLQGSYGRMASQLIEQGVIEPA